MTDPPSSPTPAVEDYLKTIYSLHERDAESVTTSRLAERLGLAASSVSGMLPRLTAQGLIEHRRYGGITLTDAGTAIALKIVRRHRLMEMFLVTHLAYRWDEVHREAEVLEHAVSDLLIERIDVALGSPRFDPHGDPIPTADGHMPTVDAHRLPEMPAGTTGSLVRVDDHDPLVLQHLTELGITLDDRLEVLEALPFGGGQLVRTGSGATHQFPPEFAAALWLRVD